MKKHSVLFAIVALMLASLACQAVMGGGDSAAPDLLPNDGGSDFPQLPTLPPVVIDDSGGITVGGESEFPMPDGATNVVNVGDVLNFQVKMSLGEAMKFYKDSFTKSGYIERTALTITSDTTFNLVFDGHESGKAIIIQGVDFGDGTVNISITLQDI